MVCLPEKGRCNITAAGEQQMTCTRRFIGIQSGEMRDAKPPESGFIVLGIFAAAENGSVRVRRHKKNPF